MAHARRPSSTKAIFDATVYATPTYDGAPIEVVVKAPDEGIEKLVPTTTNPAPQKTDVASQPEETTTLSTVKLFDSPRNVSAPSANVVVDERNIPKEGTPALGMGGGCCVIL